MADPMIVAQISADAMLKLRANAEQLAESLGIEPPAPIDPAAQKEPVLREARLKESLADFLGRAVVASKGDKKEDGYVEPSRSIRKGRQPA